MKIQISFDALFMILDRFNNSVFNSVNGTINGLQAVKFIVTNKLTDDEKNSLQRIYKSAVFFGCCTYKFAPEIKHDTITLLTEITK